MVLELIEDESEDGHSRREFVVDEHEGNYLQ